MQQATRITFNGSPILRFGDRSFKEDHFAFADSNFFQVFSFPLVQGDAAGALRDAGSVVISKTMARKYFGNEPAPGKVLVVKDGSHNFKVTGVMEDMPVASHFHFDFIASLTGEEFAKSDSWMQSNYYTYLVLPDGYDYKKLEAKLPRVVEHYMGPQLEKNMGMSLSQFRSKGNDIGLFLQKLTDIHLRSDMSPVTEIEPGGDIRYVYIFSAVALLYW